MKHFSSLAIKQWAQSIDSWKAVAFMSACAERMMPNYLRFVNETGFGDDRILRKNLDAAWSWIENGRPLADLEARITECEKCAPDTAEHSSRFTSAALDAASSIATILDAIREFEPDKAVEVASLGRDSVDLWLQEELNLDPNDAAFEQTIVTHELMQKELCAQDEDMELLKTSPDDRRMGVATLTRRWANTRGSLSP